MNIIMQNSISRKHFIASIPFFAILPGVIRTMKEVGIEKLSFSTLGCPDWSFDKIVDFAKEHGYTGIEVRGILREMDLTKAPEFSTPDAIAVTMKKMKDRGLVFVDLGSSAA